MNLPILTKADIPNIVPEATNIGDPKRGGQKLVFPCTINGRAYALKFMLTNPTIGDPGDDDSDEVTARAKREVEIMGRCVSPYIIKLGNIPLRPFDYHGQKIIYFSEEWLNGEDLYTLLRKNGPFDAAEVIRLGIHITNAISELWSFSKIHRDIKPGNIVRCSTTGNFVLLDMGLAFDLAAPSLTAFGIPGTIIYFSPEQTNLPLKRLLDFRSDIFSLGIVMYECITGRHPFYIPGMDYNQVILNILTLNPPPPSTFRPGISRDLDDTIIRMLSKKPHMRFRNCQQLIDILSRV